jgi:DNA-binding HxlR family transcriptional regulator
MKCANDKLSLLEERHALRLLSFLYSNGRSQRSCLYSAISRTTTAPMKRVNELIDMGLVKETTISSAPFAKNVELTERGRQIAGHVVEIERIISELAN